MITSPSNDPAFTGLLKSLNPTILLATTCDIQAGACFPTPDEWKIRTSTGKTIKLYGGFADSSCSGDYTGWDWTDPTDYAPVLADYDGQRFNEFIATVMADRFKPNIDVLATDGLWVTGYYPKQKTDYPDCELDIDLDRNGLNDFNESDKGETWVRDNLRQGTRRVAENIRALIGDAPLRINTGVFHTEVWDITNGLILEHVDLIHSWNYFWRTYQNFMNEALQPHFLDLNGLVDGRSNFRHMRFLLGLTLTGDGYFSNDVVFNHHGAHWFDEFDIDLGYPTSNAQPVPDTEHDGVSAYIRFFDKGALLLNPSGHTVTISDPQIANIEGYAGPYYRFQGGQDPSHNNGSPFNSIELFGEEKLGDAIILTRQPQTIVSDIFIENIEIGTSPGSHPAELIGEWIQLSSKESASVDACHGDYDSWQIDFAPWKGIYPYAYSDDPEARAIFLPQIGVAGNYEVYIWNGRMGACSNEVWTDAHNETTAAEVVIQTATTTRSITIDQHNSSGRWINLGNYHFEADDSAFIELHQLMNDGYLIADAVKLVYQNPNSDPLFSDVPADNRYRFYIESLYQDKYIAGCSSDPLMFCPDLNLLRSEIAVMILRALKGQEYMPPEPAQQIFVDVALDAWYAGWVNELYQVEFTAGCSTSEERYCPDNNVTIAEASVFFLRTKHGNQYVPPDITSNMFTDVSLSAWYTPWVHAAYQEGILEPCSQEGGVYVCPEETLLRQQAAQMMYYAIYPTPQ